MAREIPKGLYTQPEAAEILGGRKAYYALRKLGILPPPIRIGVRNGLHPAAHIDQAIDALTQVAARPLREPPQLAEGRQKAAARRASGKEAADEI